MANTRVPPCFSLSPRRPQKHFERLAPDKSGGKSDSGRGTAGDGSADDVDNKGKKEKRSGGPPPPIAGIKIRKKKRQPPLKPQQQQQQKQALDKGGFGMQEGIGSSSRETPRDDRGTKRSIVPADGDGAVGDREEGENEEEGRRESSNSGKKKERWWLQEQRRRQASEFVGRSDGGGWRWRCCCVCGERRRIGASSGGGWKTRRSGERGRFARCGERRGRAVWGSGWWRTRAGTTRTTTIRIRKMLDLSARAVTSNERKRENTSVCAVLCCAGAR